MIHDVVAAGNSVHIVVEIAVEQVSEEVAAVIYTVDHLHLIAGPEGGDHGGGTKNLYPGHNAAPLGEVRLEGQSRAVQR